MRDFRGPGYGQMPHCPQCKSARVDTIKIPRRMGEDSAEWRNLCLDCGHYCEGPIKSGGGLLWIPNEEEQA